MAETALAVAERIDDRTRATTDRVDVVFVDAERDRRFFAEVLEPALAQQRASGLYVASAVRLASRFRNQAAVCQRVEYRGARTAALVGGGGDDEEELDSDELADRLGGLLVFYTWPADRLAPRARVMQFDRGGLDELLQHCVARARRLGVRLPHSLERRLNSVVVELTQSSLMWGEPMRRAVPGAHWDMFFNRDLLERYCALLDAEMRPALPRAAPAASAAVREPVDEDPYALYARLMYESVLASDLYGESVVAPSTARRRLTVDPALAVAAVGGGSSSDSDDEVAGDATADDAASLNSYDSQVAIDAEGDRPSSLLRLDQHELSDRLFADAVCQTHFAVRAPHPRLVSRTQLVLCAAHALLVHLCAHDIGRWRAADLFYLVELAQAQLRAGAAALERPLCAAAANTLVVIQHQALAFFGCAEAAVVDAVYATIASAPDGIKGAAERLFTDAQLHHVLDAFQTSATTDYRREHAALVPVRRATPDELFRFVDAHALTSMRALLTRRRREAAAVGSVAPNPLDVVLCCSALAATPLQLVSSVRAFAPRAEDGRDFCVVWAPAPYELQRRVPGATSPTDVYLCLSARVWRVLALGAVPRLVAEQRSIGVSVREHPLVAPFLNAALDCDDADVVAHAIAGVQALTTASRSALPVTWRPGTAHARREAASCVRTLDAVVDAMASSGAVFAPEAEQARRNVLAELVRPLAALAQDGAAKHGPYRHVPARNCIFGALHAALCGDGASLAIGREAARDLAARTETSDPDLATFLRTQAALATPFGALMQTRADAQLAQETALNAGRAVECWCGASAHACERMRTLLSARAAAEAVPFHERTAGQLRAAVRQRLECCLCSAYATSAYARHIRETRTSLTKRRLHHGSAAAAGSTCAWCVRRGAVATRDPGGDADFALLYNAQAPDGAAYTTLSLVRSLAMGNDLQALKALRLCRGSNVAAVVVARNASITSRTVRRRTAAPASATNARKTADEQILEATHALLKHVAAREWPRRRTAFLVALERLALIDHKRVAAAADDADALDALIAPLLGDSLGRADNADQLAALATSTTLFPLCRAALAEPMSMGAYGFESAASNELYTLADRASSQLYRGRYPAPLSDSVPLLLPLALCNFYTDHAPPTSRPTD